MKRSLFRLAGLALLSTLLLAGCATGYILDNNVQTFSSLPTLPAQPTYRFERLPSQQASPVQAQIEALADPALFKAGLRRDDAAPKYSVQLSARIQRVLSPWADPWDGWGGRWGWGPGWLGPHGYGYGPYAGPYGAAFPRMETPWYQREVGVVVRDLGANRVVYETHAANDGPWSDNAAVLPAMFEAALQGFPNAPLGLRRVGIPIGK